MARTRATKASTGTSASATTTTTTTTTTSAESRYSLPAPAASPAKLFILPEKATSDARIASLWNPRYARPARYLVCPKSGFFEFKQISAPSTTPCSWLVEGATEKPSTQEGKEGEQNSFQALVLKGAELCVATSIDPLFLVLPALAARAKGSKSDESKRLFLSSDDHFDSISEAGHLSELLRFGDSRSLLEARMAVVCDTVEAGDEKMFRLNDTKLLAELVKKAQRMSSNRLPQSMEDKFVAKALEAPILGVRTEPSAASDGKGEMASESGSATPLLDSQTSVVSTTTVASEASAASTAATSVADEVVNAITASPEIVQLQRLRVAFDFICSSYVAPETTEQLRKQVDTGSDVVNFAPLTQYLAKLATLRQEAAALRTSDYSRKRNRDEEDDERAEKKRKKEEEEKRKKTTESRGVRDLKKVNTTGMMKLSAFFKKK